MNVIRFRLFILKVIFALIFFVIWGRLIYLQVIRYDFFKKRSDYQVSRVVDIASQRGTVYDREKVPLAIMRPVYSAYAVPIEIENKGVFAAKVARLLGLSAQDLSRKIRPGSSFVWIRRKLSEESYQALLHLDLKGLRFVEENERVYPTNELASHLIGFVGIDNQGLGGVEFQYDDHLKGKAGKWVLEGDPRGYKILSGQNKVIAPSAPGGHLILTIDRRVQYFAEKYLKAGVENSLAAGGQVVVMVPKTGEILAMAAYPPFNPNSWSKSPGDVLRNPCVTDVFEPGSVFKMVILSAALEEQIVTPGQVIVVPETIQVGGKVVREAHHREPGESDYRTVTEILQKSLNVGTSILADRVGRERFYAYIRKFGFGKRSGVNLPGESRGLIRPLKYWTSIDNATASYGQGVGVSAIQLIAAVNVVANDGIWMVPKVVRYQANDDETQLSNPYPDDKKRVISEKTAHQVRDMMISVVERGTAKDLKIPHVEIAAKTGTAQKSSMGGRGYIDGHYLSTFVGFFPAKSPQYLILVMVDSPKTSIWGSTVAGPIFRNIAMALLYGYQIPDDGL
ncbi:MAG: penicillin-binding protein 2 [Candidatus Margulisiibacteriota bacterium]